MKPIDRHAALVIIDLQKGMRFPEAGRRNNPDAERHAATLLSLWRATSRPIVHVRHISRSETSVFRPGQPGAEFQEALMPLPHEHVVEKNVPDAFAASGLERWLRVRDIRQLIIVGVSTNNSVESTARSAGNLGFDTIVVDDASFAFDLRDLSGRLWSAEDVHALSLANLAADYAEVAVTAEIVERAGRA